MRLRESERFEDISAPAGRVIDAIAAKAIERALADGDKPKAVRLARLARDLVGEINGR